MIETCATCKYRQLDESDPYDTYVCVNQDSTCFMDTVHEDSEACIEWEEARRR